MRYVKPLRTNSVSVFVLVLKCSESNPIPYDPTKKYTVPNSAVRFFFRLLLLAQFGEIGAYFIYSVFQSCCCLCSLISPRSFVIIIIIIIIIIMNSSIHL